MSTEKPPVWMISGCSTGFGRSLAKEALERGWPTVLTAREPKALDDLVALAPNLALALRLDVTKPDEITAAVATAMDRFGRINVLVNNAGYGYRAIVEEAEDAEIRHLFETNVFGAINLTRAVLPAMRQRRGGHIVNISSTAGVASMPSLAFYSATKHALEGFSAGLAAEMAPLGVKVMVVEPGAFRTDFGNRSLRVTPSHTDGYPEPMRVQPVDMARPNASPGDPERAAKAIIDAVLSSEAPSHLVLGKGAVGLIEATLTRRLEEARKWSDVAVKADYPT